MPRYFLELSYLGTRYSGFQVQENATTVQGMVEAALATLLRLPVACTGSSRTDAGVHAFCNYFHFDVEAPLPEGVVYRLNALLPADIAVRSVRRVRPDAHCRFDALERSYRYVLYGSKDPFLSDRGWFYPYPLDAGLLSEAAALVAVHRDFSAFAKRGSRPGSHLCTISRSVWRRTPAGWEYEVTGNRFLRGMVRGLVGTMLQVGRRRMSMEAFAAVLSSGDNRAADFTPPGRGLFLLEVRYPEACFR